MTSTNDLSNLLRLLSVPEADEAQAAASVKTAAVGVVNQGPMVPGIVHALAAAGVGEIVLIGDGPLDELAAQQSHHYRAGDAGRTAGQVLAAQLAPLASGSALRPIAGLPATKLDWQETIRGLSLVVAPIVGPILFLRWVHELNQAALDAGTPWIVVAMPTHSELMLGPTFIPSKTACFTCYEMRYKTHLKGYDAYLPFEQHLRARPEIVDFGSFPPFAAAGASLTAQEVLRALLPGTEPLTIAKLIVLDFTTMQVEHNPLLPLPRCTVCSPTRNAPPSREWR